LAQQTAKVSRFFIPPAPLIELGNIAAPASLSHVFSTLSDHISNLKFPPLFVSALQQQVVQLLFLLHNIALLPKNTFILPKETTLSVDKTKTRVEN